MLKQNQAEDRRASPAFEVRQQKGNEPEPPSLASSILLAASPTQISCSKFKGCSFENGLRLLPFPGEPTVCVPVFPALLVITVTFALCVYRKMKAFWRRRQPVNKAEPSNLRSNGRRRELNLPPSENSSSILHASSAVISLERCFDLPLTSCWFYTFLPSTQTQEPRSDLLC